MITRITASFPSSSLALSDGEVDVAPHRTVEVPLVPHVAGTYFHECRHFLRRAFSMLGTIEVA